MNSTHKGGVGPCFNDERRLQILDLVEEPSPPSLRNIGRQFDVSESAIKSLIKKKDEIRMQIQQKIKIQEKPCLEHQKENALNYRNTLYA